MERKWMDLVLERLNRRNAVLFRAQDPLLRPLAEALGQASRLAVARWALEAEGWIDVGRTLPEHYLYFEGDGVRNHYSTEYGGGEYWRP